MDKKNIILSALENGVYYQNSHTHDIIYLPAKELRYVGNFEDGYFTYIVEDTGEHWLKRLYFSEYCFAENEINTAWALTKEELLDNISWKPIMGEIYYSIGTDLNLYREIWTNDSKDSRNALFNNCYRTTKEAEDRLEYLKIKKQLKKYAISSIRKYVATHRTYCRIVYSTSLKKAFLSLVSCDYIPDKDAIIFEDEAHAVVAIKEIGEERLKKYYLGVED